MVQLDHQLLYEARLLINEANVHRLKEMIFAYEQAVTLHNAHWRDHEVYQAKCELELRRYLLADRMKALMKRVTTAHHHAA